MASIHHPLPGELQGSLREYRTVRGADLLQRSEGFYQWQESRRQAGFWPYARTTKAGPQTACEISDDAGRRSVGVNFGSQDYLGLSQHPAIMDAAREAIGLYGVHSAGSPAFMGNTGYSRRLEAKI